MTKLFLISSTSESACFLCSSIIAANSSSVLGFIGLSKGLSRVCIISEIEALTTLALIGIFVSLNRDYPVTRYSNRAICKMQMQKQEMWAIFGLNLRRRARMPSAVIVPMIFNIIKRAMPPSSNSIRYLPMGFSSFS